MEGNWNRKSLLKILFGGLGYSPIMFESLIQLSFLVTAAGIN